MTATESTRLKHAIFHKSAVVPVGTAITIGESGGATIGYEAPFCFAGVEFFSDDTGTEAAYATPSAGTVAFAVTTHVNPQFTDAIPTPSINASAPESVSWEAPTKTVVATASGVTGATHWRLNLWALEQ